MTTNILAIKHNYQINADKTVTPKPYRPKSIGDAMKMIAGVFERNRWDVEAQSRYFKLKGIDAERIEGLTADEVRTLLAAMERSHLILFAD